MKLAVLYLVPAVLLLSACSNGSGGDGSGSTTSVSATSSSGTVATTASPSGPASGTSVLELNQNVRKACESSVQQKAPGATFGTPGSLRATSSPEGKLYTVTGAAQVAGVAHAYTCSVTAKGDSLEVTDTTVG